MNEIGNFVKSVFPRLVSPSGQNILGDLGVGLTDEQGNLRDIMTIYKEVAIALKDVNQADKIDAVKGLAGTYHISRMQTLLDDLASADSMYEKMYESSANSANSAMNENEKYMQSLQARINVAKVTIEEVALALGEAFMTEGMVQGLQAFATILKSITAVISTVGGLPPILLGVVTILTLFSNRFGDIVKNLSKSIAGFKLFGGSARNAGDGVNNLGDNVINLSDRQNQNTKDNDKNTDSTNRNTEAKKNASKASRFLSLGFLGLGVASVALGVIFETLLRKMGEARQRQEEWEAKLKQTKATYTDNKEEIKKLADQYDELDGKMGINPDTSTIREYHEVTNKLAELMPSLKRGEDEYGNAIIDSSGLVKGKINLLDEQIEREERLAELQKKVELQEQVDDAFKTIEKRNKQLKDDYPDLEDTFKAYEKQWTNLVSEDDIGMDIKIKDIEDVYALYDHILKRLDTLPDNYNSNASDHLEVMKAHLESSLKDVSQYEDELSTAYTIVREHATMEIEDIINANEALSDSAKQSAIDIGASAIQYAKTEESINGVQRSIEKILDNDDVSSYLVSFSEGIQTANEDTAKSFYDLTAKEAELKSFAEAILKHLGTNTQGYNEIEKSLNNAIAGVVDFNAKILTYQEESGKSYEEALLWVSVQEELNGAVTEGTDILGDYSSVVELLTGITSEQVENVRNLMGVYELLSGRTNLSTQETQLLARSIGGLTKLYPELYGQTDLRLDMIEEEIRMQELLEETYDLSVEGKLNQEEEMTLATSIQTANRLAILREELVALRNRNELAKNYKPTEEIMPNGEIKYSYNLDDFNTNKSFWLPDKAMEDLYIAQIEESQKKVEGLNGSLKTIIDTSNERDKANKENAKSTDAVTKITEKYALALKQLDTALKNVQNRQKQYPTRSEAYRKALREENQLILKQIELNEQKIKDLENVARTAPSSPSTTTTASYSNTTNSYASGSGVKDQVWNFFKNKGLSDSAVAGIMGNLQQESNFNTSAVNEIGASGIAQWLGGRKTGLKNFASSRGTSWTDLNTQLEWLWKELNGAEVTTKSILDKRYGGLSALNNMTPAQAAKAFEDSFERSGGSALQKRMNNANAYYSQYAGKSVPNVSYSTSTSSGDSAVDIRQKALEEIETLKQTNISLRFEYDDKQFEEIKSKFEDFQYGRDVQDSLIAQESAKQENMLEYAKEYEKSLWVQHNSERRKLANYKQEYEYVTQLLKSGKLNALQTEELQIKQRELNEEVQNSANSVKEYYEAIISSRFARYDNQIKGFQDTLDYEAVKIQTVDKASERYNKTLGILNKARKSQVEVMQQELAYAKRVLSEGNLTIALYEELAQKVKDLTRELIESSLAIQQTNFDMIQSIASVYDEQLDDIDYLLERSQTIMGMYEEKSGDYNNELMYQLELQNEKLLKIDEKRQQIQSEMLKADLSVDHVKQLEEQLEDLNSQYQTLKASIVSTNKSIADSKKVAEEELMSSLDELADRVVEAYKAYIEEARDIRLDGLEKEIELEEERHDKVIKQYEEELDAFNKIIDARLKALSEEDNDRSYNKQMDKFAKEREEIVRKMNLVELDTSSEGKSQYKKLQEELAELDENIAEAQYERELEQTEKHYEELLTDKEELINGRIELEDKEYDKTVELLNKEKAYYDKYYTDLLNDEKKFADLTALVHAQKFDEIEQEFDIMIGELEASLPDLLDTFDGTWQGVGASLRQNVINELKDAMELFDEFVKKQEEAVRFGETITNENGSSLIEKDMPGSGDNGQLTDADLKVILAKFMTDKIAPNEKGVRAQNIREKAHTLASEGRADNSKIASNSGINEILDSLSSAQLKQVGYYFQNNSDASQFITRDYLDYIESYGKSFQDSKQITTADMQVLTAKYIKDVLNKKTSDTKIIADNSQRANDMAQQGRSNGSLIPSLGSSFNDLIGRYSKDQLGQLSSFMLSHASIIANPQLRDEFIKYANQLKTSSMPLGLDTGGMTKGWGSTGGVDGKGGKYSILHQNEIVSNPIDTSRLLKISNILENIHLASPLLRGGAVAGGDTININFGDIYEATASQAESFGKKIMSTIRKERGGKW